MPEHPIRPAVGNQVPPALRPPRWLSATLSVASAAAIGFVPSLIISSPAHAAPGAVTISEDLETEEGEAFTFDLRREGGATTSLTLNYAVTPTLVNGATAGADYTAISGTTTFNPSTRSTVKRFYIRGISDNRDEFDEGFTITFTDSVGGIVAVAGGVLVDDDATPTYTLGVSPDPTPEAAGNAVITATLSAASNKAITIPVTTTPGSATAGDDFTPLSNASIVIAPGATTGTVNVPILDDTADEADTETFTVAGGTGTNVTGTANVSISITDNDALPTVAVTGPATAVEGLPLTFPVTLSAASNRTVTVQVDTGDGTAAAPADYAAVAAQTVTFNPGETTRNVVVPTVIDGADETDPETLTFTLSAPSNATLGTATTSGGITDYEAPTVTLTPTTVTEGDANTTQDFTVTLSTGVNRQVSVGYTVTPGTATPGNDFTAVPPGTLTFAPNETTKTISVPMLGDMIAEGASENFTITLTDPNGVLGASASLGANVITITDNEATPTFSVADKSVDEDAVGDAVFTVTLSGPASQDVDFTLGAADGTAVIGGISTGANDFQAPQGTLSIPAGSTTGTFTVPIVNDLVFEDDETAPITVTLAGNETGATGGPDASTLTITDDDNAPSVVLTPVTAAEGADAQVRATITGVAEENIPVTVTLLGASVGGADTAEVEDFVNDTPVPVNIPGGTTGPGVLLRTFALSDDLIDEAAETVQVSLASAVVGPATGMVTITDAANDLPPSVAIGDQTVVEGASTAVPVSLTYDPLVTSATSTERTIVVNYATAAGTALGGADYDVPANGSALTFTPGGPATQNIVVPVTDDAGYELNEAFTVNLTSPTPDDVVITDASGVVTISANDQGARPTFSVANVSRLENAAGPAQFTVTLQGAVPQAVDFAVSLTGVTAVDAGVGWGDDDFDMPLGTLRIEAGQSSGTITVPVNADSVFEGAETATLSVALANNENDAAGGPATATLTIQNDDAVPTLTLTAPNVSEGGTAEVSATLSGPTQNAISVDVALQGLVVNGSDAAEVSDFSNTADPVTVSIPGGNHTSVPVVLRSYAASNDLVDEVAETVRVTVTSSVLATATATQTITDAANDLPPSVAIGDQTVVEGASTAVPVSLTYDPLVTSATSTERTIVVNYATAAGTALGGADYDVPANGSALTFTPGGPATQNIVVPITDDPAYELNEAFTVNLTSPTPDDVVITDPSGVVTISANDQGARPTFSVANVSRLENAAGPAQFTVTLQGAVPQAVDFAVSLTGVTAVDAGVGWGDDDFDMPLGTLRIEAGQSSGTITVPVNADSVFEGAETATLSVALANNENDAAGGPATATLTIQNDDAVPTLTLTAPNVSEGGTAEVSATLSGPTQNAISVDVALQGLVVNGSDAAEVSDFSNTADPVTVSIPGGNHTSVPVVLRSYAASNDLVDEVAETVGVTVTSSVLATATATQTITDAANDLPPSVAIGDQTVVEGASTAVPVSLTYDPLVTSATSTERTIVVNYATAAGTALGGADYDVPANGSALTFTRGPATQNIVVPITDDPAYELNEAFTVNLTSPTPDDVVITDPSGVVTISANDQGARPTFSVANVSRLENAAGPAQFTVTLQGAVPQAVDFAVSLTGVTAVDAGIGWGDDDFDMPLGTLRIEAGQSSGTITVPVNADSVFEGAETATLSVALANNENDAAGGPATATLTIQNDDAVPTVVLDPVTASEGGNAIVTAVVTGVAQADIPVTVSLLGAPVGGADPAESTDFVNDTATPTVISAGTTGPVTLRTFALSNDAVDEVSETVQVTLTSPTIATATGMVTITDDVNDRAPSVAIGDQTVAETVVDTAVPVTLIFDPLVTSATSTERPIVVNYTTAGGTATTPADFTARTSSITIPAGSTSGTIAVPIVDDAAYEVAETFQVNAMASPNDVAVSDGSGTVTISASDQDARPTFSVANVSRLENAAGPAQFTVTLQGAVPQAVDFAVSLTGVTAVDAGVGWGDDDFDMPLGTLRIEAGQSSGTITVPVNADSVFEGAETATLSVALANNENDAAGGPATATLTIQNDDAVPTLTLTAPNVSEGGTAEVSATLSGPTQNAISVDVALQGLVVNGSDAAEVSDFSNTADPVTVSIPGGNHTSVPVVLRSYAASNDLVDEVAETVRVTVTSSVLATATATQTITDAANDLPPSVAIGDQTVVEGASTAVPVSLTYDPLVTSATSTERTIVVNYATAAGTALGGADYDVPANGSALTFTPGGPATQNIVVPITDDPAYELNEAFTVNLTSPTPDDVVITDPSGVVTISANDQGARPTFSVANISRAENAAGPAQFTVTLNGSVPQPVTFDVALANGSAVDTGDGPGSNDFDLLSGTLTIGAGESSGTITVPVHDDTVFEGPESATLTVSLANGETDALGGPDNSTLTITNDDAAPTLTVESLSGVEGSTVELQATVTGVAQDAIDVSVALQGESVDASDPAEDGDFTAEGPVTVTIPGGNQTGAPLTLRTLTLSNDAADEAAVETVRATVTSSVLATATGVVSIEDAADDLPPTVSLSDQTVGESAKSTSVAVKATFDPEVTAATSTERPIVVSYTTEEDTATAPSDFTASTSSVTIEPGSEGTVIAVPIVGDNRFEPDEQFDIHITSVSPDDVEITEGTATVEITNDDPELTTFSVGDVSVAEDDGTAAFTVELSNPTLTDVAFNVAVADGTAVDLGTGGGRNDYNPPATRMVIPAGQTSRTIAVPINNDAVYEGDENAVVTVSLAGATHGVGGAPDASTLTITNDDAAPRIALNTQTAAEGAEVAVVATITGVAQDATSFDVTVGGEGEGADPAESLDYTAYGTAVVPGGTASGSKVTLQTIRFESDSIDEATEAVRVRVRDVAKNVQDASSVYQITDDVNDLPPSVTVADAVVGEATGTAGVGVTLTFRGDTTTTERDVVVHHYTADGTARSGHDFTGGPDGTLTIKAGQTSGTINVPIMNDSVDEVDQDFTVRVRSVSPTEAQVADGVAAVRITDDDDAAAPTVVAPEQRVGVGTVSVTGTAGEGVKVELLSAPYAGGTATVVASTVADNTGAYSFTRTLSAPARLTTRVGTLLSAPAPVRIQHSPTFTASSITAKSATLRVVGNPPIAGLPVTFERANTDGSWTLVSSGVTNSAGELSKTLTGLVTGTTVTYRAVIAGNAPAGLVAGTSTAKAVTIR